MEIPNSRLRRESVLRTQFHVLMALILRDMRTRFFGHAAGYLIAIAWPLAHIAILLVIYSATGRVTPYGESPILFFAVALAPVMSFIYASRWIMMSAVTNKPLLAFPIVKLTDVLFARAILETLGSCCMFILLLITLTAMGIDARPVSINEAMKALGCAMLLGIGVGFVNGLIAVVAPLWVTAYALTIIVLYITSGVLFVPDQLPNVAREILSWNPLLHAVEWIRTAYYGGYESRTLDKPYLIGWGAGSLFLSLVMLRYGRRFLLHQR